MHLLLNSPGSSIRVKAGMFQVKSPTGRHRLSPEQVKGILVSAPIRLSSEVVLLAIAHEIDILFLDNAGRAAGRIWTHRYGSIATIRQQQLAFVESTAGAKWVASQLNTRLKQAAEQLQYLAGTGHDRQELANPAIAALKQYGNRIVESATGPLSSKQKSAWRGWEGTATRQYYQSLSRLMPPEYAFGGRSRRPASDLFNCALNYTYGILYAQVELALIRAGIDPYLGVLHRAVHNRPVLVYDAIEAYRHWAERVVIDLCLDRQLTHEMVDKQEEGYWLNEAGKACLVPAFFRHLEKSGAPAVDRQENRLHQLLLDCRAFATQLRAQGESPKNPN